MPPSQKSPIFHASLSQLGWSNHFIQQLSLDEWDTFIPARIIQQHRSELEVAIEGSCLTVCAPLNLQSQFVVGDWVLLDQQHQVQRLLERKSSFSRKASGSKVGEQLIASNIDTLFIVTSLNQDFNLNRIERYLVLANEAGVEPVIILSKADLCESQDQIDNFVMQVQKLDALLMVVPLNTLDEANLEKLSPWCKPGQTLALLGSSGVGKSTLANLLLHKKELVTGSIREDDAKGRHTTTSRSLHVIEPSDQLAGGLVLDSPGMRELQLVNSEEGIEETFHDIMELAQQCKFSDCHHETSLSEKSGCAVQAAIKTEQLDARRLASYQKLLSEDAFNSATLAQKREKDKQLGKMIKSALKSAKARKKR